MSPPDDGAPSDAQDIAPDGRRLFAQRLSKWLPVILWMGAMFWLSGIPGYRFPHLRFTLEDKIAHACAYGAGGLLIARALPRALPAILLTAAYGASDEWHQSMVRGRESDFADWVADCIGALLGVAAYRLASRIRFGKRRR